MNCHDLRTGLRTAHLGVKSLMCVRLRKGHQKCLVPHTAPRDLCHSVGGPDPNVMSLQEPSSPCRISSRHAAAADIRCPLTPDVPARDNRAPWSPPVMPHRHSYILTAILTAPQPLAQHEHAPCISATATYSITACYMQHEVHFRFPSLPR